MLAPFLFLNARVLCDAEDECENDSGILPGDAAPVEEFVKKIVRLSFSVRCVVDGMPVCE